MYDGSIGGGVAAGDTMLLIIGMVSGSGPFRCCPRRCRLYNMLGVLIECLGELFARTSFFRSWSTSCELMLVEDLDLIDLHNE